MLVLVACLILSEARYFGEDRGPRDTYQLYACLGRDERLARKGNSPPERSGSNAFSSKVRVSSVLSPLGAVPSRFSRGVLSAVLSSRNFSEVSACFPTYVQVLRVEMTLLSPKRSEPRAPSEAPACSATCYWHRELIPKQINTGRPRSAIFTMWRVLTASNGSSLILEACLYG